MKCFGNKIKLVLVWKIAYSPVLICKKDNIFEIENAQLFIDL